MLALCICNEGLSLLVKYFSPLMMSVALLVDGVMNTEIAICRAEGKGSCTHFSDFPLVSILGVGAIALLSAVAGVSSEFLVKRDFDTTIWLQNAQMYAFGVAFNLVNLAARGSGREGGVLRDFARPEVAAVVASAVAYGLITATVIKHLSNVEKVYANAGSIFVNASVSAWEGNFELSLPFILGAGVVCIAIYLYAREKALAVAAAEGPGELLPAGGGGKGADGADVENEPLLVNGMEVVSQAEGGR